jgi:transposase-like protein
MTTRKRHSPEQVVRKFAQADRMLAEGKDVADVCRELQIAEQTYYRWRNAELEKAALKEIASGNF